MSNCFFRGSTVAVRGLPWCRTEEVEIPRRRLVANVLCKGHNEELSPLDHAGVHQLDVLSEYHRLATVRTRMQHSYWRVIEHEIDGLVLERWFLKCLLNIVASQRQAPAWRLDGSPAAAPPRVLVEAVFGRARLTAPMGLYLLAMRGEIVGPTDGIAMVQYQDPDGRVSAARFGVRGFRFLMVVCAERVPTVVPDHATVDPEIRGSTLLRHPREVVRVSGPKNARSQVVRFGWPEEPSGP